MAIATYAGVYTLYSYSYIKQNHSLHLHAIALVDRKIILVKMILNACTMNDLDLLFSKHCDMRYSLLIANWPAIAIPITVT